MREHGASRLRIVVTGLIAQYPLGGVAWDYLHYALGLARLGHDVYYLEDTDQWPYNPHEGGVSAGCAFNVEYLRSIMERYGLGDRWAYRFGGGPQWFGLPDAKRSEILASADLLLNVSGTLARPEELRHVPRLAYIDSDPVFTQVRLAAETGRLPALVDMHDVHFSFGERIQGADVPDTGHLWRPTRQPVVLSEWPVREPERDGFTTVMNWTSFAPVEHEGRSYGQKDVELARFLDLPSLVAPTLLELAINEGKTERTPRDLLTRHGWRLVDPAVVCPDGDSYREYLSTSAAEWSVAKHGYVQGRPGWFSCRSACYLAAGKPVVVQDTGFTSILPTGEGLHAFSTVDEAVAGIEAVVSDPARHARAARGIAEAYFDAETVLTRLVEDAMAANASLAGATAHAPEARS
jgi:hypothetical protein